MDISKKVDIGVVCFIILGLFLAIEIHLLPALIAGMITFMLMEFSESVMKNSFKLGNKSRFCATLFISVLLMALISSGLVYLCSWIYHTFQNPTQITEEIKSIMEKVYYTLPSSISNVFPNDIVLLKNKALSFIQVHLETIKAFGKGTTHTLITVLLGMVIGIMIAATKNVTENISEKLLVKKIKERMRDLVDVFKHVIVAQFAIASFNTFMTFLFLVVLLPLLGIEFPFVKILICCTFIIGLIPILGNLVVNVLVFAVGLSVSFTAGIMALLFLIFIHKFEYFLNAKIIGSRIQAKAWELLLVMLIMETVFGLVGLIAAPIIYSYIKKELKNYNWI